MARGHRRRFAKLHQTLKDTGFAAATGAAGEYLNYLKGTNVLKITRKPKPALRKLLNVGVVPFNEPDTATTTSSMSGGYETTATAQGMSIQKVFDGIIPYSLLGIEIDLTKCNTHSGFYSAELRVTIKQDSAAASEHTSQITKRKYNSYPTRAGAIPFGRAVGIPLPTNPASTSTKATAYEEASREFYLQKIKGAKAGGWTVVGAQVSPEEWVDKGVTGKTVVVADLPGIDP
jgi:hypothetical protein